MKKIIYKGTIEENDYNRVKDIDSENYITPNGKTVLPKLTQMPLRDLAILSFTNENELKKYYTGRGGILSVFHSRINARYKDTGQKLEQTQSQQF